jgi:Na+/proline symporter
LLALTLASGAVSNKDAILPYYALTKLPEGLAGLLIAAILGSSMRWGAVQ